MKTVNNISNKEGINKDESRNVFLKKQTKKSTRISFKKLKSVSMKTRKISCL